MVDGSNYVIFKCRPIYELRLFKYNDLEITLSSYPGHKSKQAFRQKVTQIFGNFVLLYTRSHSRRR